MKGDECKLSSLVMPLSHASCHDSARLCGFPLHLIRIYPSHDPKFRHFVLYITNPVQPRLSSAFMQNWIFAGIGGWDKGFPVKELRQGARGWGRERGVSNYCNYAAAPPPTRSLPIPNPTARVPRTQREGGGAKLLRAAEGRDPYSRKVVRTPEAPVPLPRRAAGHKLDPAQSVGGPPISPVVMTTPSPCLSTPIKTSESSGVLFQLSGRSAQQEVLCQLPRDSQCRAFPAKTCWRHPVANAHTFAVKRTGARCPIPGSAEEQLQ